MATKKCSKCGVEKPLSDYWMKRPNKGQLYAQCKSCITARNRAWFRANSGKSAEYQSAWINRDPERARAVYREMKRRKDADPVRRFSSRIQTAVSVSLRGGKKHASTYKALGYSLDDLRAHLERQFVGGMTWENYGSWHVDHIVPLTNFSITGTDCPEFRAAWSLANLRPLWAHENVRKSGRRTHLL